MLPKPLSIVVSLCAVALLASCATTPPGVGTWGDPAETGTSHLVLGAGGELTGNDGCNSIVGTWAEEEGEFAFSDLVTTQMLCTGVDVWLSDATSATVDGDKLIVADKSGAEIGTLERQQ